MTNDLEYDILKPLKYDESLSALFQDLGIKHVSIGDPLYWSEPATIELDSMTKRCSHAIGYANFPVDLLVKDKKNYHYVSPTHTTISGKKYTFVSATWDQKEDVLQIKYIYTYKDHSEVRTEKISDLRKRLFSQGKVFTWLKYFLDRIKIF